MPTHSTLFVRYLDILDIYLERNFPYRTLFWGYGIILNIDKQKQTHIRISTFDYEMRAYLNLCAHTPWCSQSYILTGNLCHSKGFKRTNITWRRKSNHTPKKAQQMCTEKVCLTYKFVYFLYSLIYNILFKLLINLYGHLSPGALIYIYKYMF